MFDQFRLTSLAVRMCPCSGRTSGSCLGTMQKRSCPRTIWSYLSRVYFAVCVFGCVEGVICPTFRSGVCWCYLAAMCHILTSVINCESSHEQWASPLSPQGFSTRLDIGFLMCVHMGCIQRQGELLRWVVLLVLVLVSCFLLLVLVLLVVVVVKPGGWLVVGGGFSGW